MTSAVAARGSATGLGPRARSTRWIAAAALAVGLAGVAAVAAADDSPPAPLIYRDHVVEVGPGDASPAPGAPTEAGAPSPVGR